MTFAAGLVAGLVAATIAGLVVFRARVISGRPSSRYLDFRALVAIVALVISVVALVRSNHSGTARRAANPSDAPASTAPKPSDAPPPSSSTSSTTFGVSEVTVPNVIGLSQSDATARLSAVGLKAHIQTLPLSSVPAGFVVTETPAAFSTTTSNAVVVLGISTAA